MSQPNPNKPVHAHNVPTPTNGELSRGQVSPEQIKQATGKSGIRDARRPSHDPAALEAEAKLKAAAESKPVSGTPSRPYVDEPGTPLRTRTKTQDPADAAVQTRSATDAKAKDSAGQLRNQ